MARIFLSHSSSDKSFVLFLADKLRQAGHFVWVAEAEINVGDSLIQKIADGLEQSDYVVAVISKVSVQSNWVRKELQLAMYREVSGIRVHVLPVILDHCIIPYFLRDKLYADFSNASRFSFSMEQLLRAIMEPEVDLRQRGAREGDQSITSSFSSFRPKAVLDNVIGSPNVGSFVGMKDTKDLNLAKQMRHCWIGAILFCIMATVLLITLLMGKRFFPSAFPSNEARFVAATMLGAYVAGFLNTLEGSIALFLLQIDKPFAFELERLGGWFPFRKNWRYLFRSSWRWPIRILFLLSAPFRYVLPFLVLILIYLFPP